MIDWFDKLGKELDAIKKETGLAPSRGFIYWFIKAYHRSSKDDALKSLTDKPNDKTVDAIYVDDPNQRIFVYQSKYTVHGNDTTFSSDDLRVFSIVAKYFKDNASESSIYRQANDAVKIRLNYALECYNNKGYKLELFFITTHKDNPNSLSEIKEIEPTLNLSVFAFQKIKNLFLDWEEDAIPRIPEVSIKISPNEVFIKEKSNTSKSFIVTIPSENLIDLYQKYGEILFARNVREFLKETKNANQAMKKTLKNRPEMFWYFNNGITIICEKASYDSEGACIKVTNPQIINGGQTTRMIYGTKVKTAEVLARIIEIPEDEKGREMVHDVIVANNTQSPVKWIDLRSNHPYQVALQREMEKVGYFYQRKQNEYERKLKENGYYINSCCQQGMIQNDILSQVIVAIKKNPYEAKAGIESIFEHKFMDVFENWSFVYDYILPYQIHDIFKKNCDLRNLRKIDGRFSEESANAYKHAKWHALHLFFEYGKILDKSESWKKSVSDELKDNESDIYGVISNLAAKILSTCYDLFKKNNKEDKDAIDYFKVSKVLDDFKDGFPKNLENKIFSELNRIG